MPRPTLTLPRAELSIEEPWDLPAGVTAISLRRATDGNAPRMATTLALWWDEEYLNALFTGDDDEVLASFFNHDEPLYEEDVVELFLAPAEPSRYFEIEVNPLGTTFDSLIHNPDDRRDTMSADLSWTCEGLFAATRRTPHHFATIIRIPFASLGTTPKRGDTWLGNAFRIDRSQTHGSEFSAWSPTLRDPADFHVTAAFGTFVFA
jgi:hypothetical protein